MSVNTFRGGNDQKLSLPPPYHFTPKIKKKVLARQNGERAMEVKPLAVREYLNK